MVSLMQFVGIIGLLLLCFVMYTEQAAGSTSFVDEQQFNLEKRRIDAHARNAIPLFRGSNLGIFIRKRPFSLYPEHSVIRRKESRSPSTNDDNYLAELLSNNEHMQRRFDDYSENPGPMFGR
ncbi:hypothetical protein I4U23_009756 [Adineta vaga]|nr:hypothetical protein I4U23_009756 [Adineta vaga]